MTEILIDPRFSAHLAIFGVAILTFYKIGDRADLTQKALDGTSQTLDLIRANIVDFFLDTLRAASERTRTIDPQVIPGQSYMENPSNFLESETLRTFISEFIRTQAGPIADYRVLHNALSVWLLVTKLRSWVLLLLILVEAGNIFVMFVLDGVLQLAFVRSYHNLLFGVSIFVIALVLGTLPVILFYHDRLITLRQRHNPY